MEHFSNLRDDRVITDASLALYDGARSNIEEVRYQKHHGERLPHDYEADTIEGRHFRQDMAAVKRECPPPNDHAFIAGGHIFCQPSNKVIEREAAEQEAAWDKLAELHSRQTIEAARRQCGGRGAYVGGGHISCK